MDGANPFGHLLQSARRELHGSFIFRAPVYQVYHQWLPNFILVWVHFVDITLGWISNWVQQTAVFLSIFLVINKTRGHWKLRHIIQDHYWVLLPTPRSLLLICRREQRICQSMQDSEANSHLLPIVWWLQIGHNCPCETLKPCSSRSSDYLIWTNNSKGVFYETPAVVLKYNTASSPSSTQLRHSIVDWCTYSRYLISVLLHIGGQMFYTKADSSSSFLLPSRAKCLILSERLLSGVI